MSNPRQPYPNELWHYGILGQKWGVRRYQNPDGSYTELGRRHYDLGEAREKRSMTRRQYLASKLELETKVADRLSVMNKKELSELSEELKKEIQDGAGYYEQLLDKQMANMVVKELGLKSGDTFFDENNEYGRDHDGNRIYNKSDAQVMKERASNPKLKNMTDKQYKVIDRDLASIGGERYAVQPLSVRQKLIKDYYDTPRINGRNNGTLSDQYMWDMFNPYEHGARPKKNQALQNQYDSYLELHPNSELTFSEFNNWFYEA